MDKKSTKEDSSNMGANDDHRIPFSATELKHSLSEGATPRTSKCELTRRPNGYRRMHSFHNTLSDNNWDFDDYSPVDGSFLPSDFRDTLLEGFPELQKNGLQHHSFDDDIFGETAERFTSEFFSESEIDDIPKSTLFHRTGLRRSTSNLGPRTKTSKMKSRESESDMDRVKSSRQSKIEELLKLKEKLEVLKGSWQEQKTLEEETAHQTKHTADDEKEEDSANNHMEKTNEKGIQKRRRLSSLKHSHSLSSKVMEELVEEDEQDADRDTLDQQDQNDDAGSPVSPTRRVNGCTSPLGIRRNFLDDAFGTVTRGASQRKMERSLHKLNGDISVRRKIQDQFDEDAARRFHDDCISKRLRDFGRSDSPSFDSKDAHGSFSDRRASADREDKTFSSNGHNMTRAVNWKERADKNEICDSCLRSSDECDCATSSGQGQCTRSPDSAWGNFARLSKMSSRHERQSVDSFLGAFSLPRGKFFEFDFFIRDWKRHQLVEEIGDIQRHLADITKRELGKRRNRPATIPAKQASDHPKPFELNRSTSEIDLQTQRSNLTSTLKDLLCKKQEREQQIRNRIEKLRNEQQTAVVANAAYKNDAEDRKDETTFQGTPASTETTDEDEVSYIMSRAGAEQYIPIVKKNEVTIDKLYQFIPSDFAELDITDLEMQRRLQDEIDKHYVEQKNAQLKAAELEGPACVKGDSQPSDVHEGGKVDGVASMTSEELPPCSLISSAPDGYEPEVPVHVSAECVVCLDEQSNLLFLNCGHVCCCYNCSFNLVLCPLCRSEIESKLIMNDNLPDWILHPAVTRTYAGMLEQL